MSNEELETRSVELEFREEAEEGVLEGIAVPYGQITSVGGRFQERFEADSVEPEGTVWLYRDHKHPIGEIVATEHRTEGFWVRAKVAMSDLAIETRSLLRDGSLRSLSVGFIPVETRDENGVRVVTKARLREVSVVSRPAYAGAAILSVRSEEEEISEGRAASSVSENKEGQEMTDENKTDAAVTELRELVEDTNRRLDTLSIRDEEPVLDTRSAGQIMRGLLDGDEAIATEMEQLEARAYEGGVQADGINKPAWVANLVRIFDASSSVLTSVFGQGTLPDKGNQIEINELDTSTLTVTEQVEEGDDIPMGVVKFKTRAFDVKTYAGGAELSQQAIDRATVSVLNTTLEGLALEAGRRKKIVLRSAFNAAVAAREAVASNGGVVLLGAAVGSANAGNWEDAVVDAAIKFEQVGLATPDALIVSPSVFKRLRALTVAGERVFTIADKNSSGTLNLTGLVGTLAGIPVVVDIDQTGDKAAFVSGRALKQYDSALVTLSAQKITNLTRQIAVYRYGAVATEIPTGIVPVKLAAS